MAKSKLIRCPVCLASQTENDSNSPDSPYYCGNCKRAFLYKNALPLSGARLDFGNPGDGQSAAADLSAHSSFNYAGAGDIKLQSANNSNSLPYSVVTEPALGTIATLTTWAIALLLLFLIVATARPYMMGIKGPEFLFQYVLYLVAIYFLLHTARKFWLDTIHISLIALVFFETIGIFRYIDGTSVGMHNFTIMFFIMVFGGIAMFLRADNLGTGSDSGYSSCSSGCGSGCGGGCGGCGG